MNIRTLLRRFHVERDDGAGTEAVLQAVFEGRGAVVRLLERQGAVQADVRLDGDAAADAAVRRLCGSLTPEPEPRMSRISFSTLSGRDSSVSSPMDGRRIFQATPRMPAMNLTMTRTTLPALPTKVTL